MRGQERRALWLQDKESPLDLLLVMIKSLDVYPQNCAFDKRHSAFIQCGGKGMTFDSNPVSESYQQGDLTKLLHLSGPQCLHL